MIEVRHRGRAILLGYVLFCICYLGAAHIGIREPRLLSPSVIDRAIPFLPWTIVVYLSQFAFLFLALWLQTDSRALTRAFAAIAVATLLSCAVFVVWPTTIARPSVESVAFDALWLFDVPSNCFPSLHVALAAIAAAFWPRRRAVGVVWAVAIALSTLTTKQHYAVDVLGGTVVAAVGLYAARRVHGTNGTDGDE